MSIDVSAKNVKLWKNEHEGRKGKFYTFSVSASKKMQDGSYKNKSVRLFSKEIPQSVPNGTMIDFEGFLTVDVFQSRDGSEVSNIAIYANKVIFHDWEEDIGDDFERFEEDIPF